MFIRNRNGMSYLIKLFFDPLSGVMRGVVVFACTPNVYS